MKAILCDTFGTNAEKLFVPPDFRMYTFTCPDSYIGGINENSFAKIVYDLEKYEYDKYKSDDTIAEEIAQLEQEYRIKYFTKVESKIGDRFPYIEIGRKNVGEDNGVDGEGPDFNYTPERVVEVLNNNVAGAVCKIVFSLVEAVNKCSIESINRYCMICLNGTVFCVNLPNMASSALRNTIHYAARNRRTTPIPKVAIFPLLYTCTPTAGDEEGKRDPFIFCTVPIVYKKMFKKVDWSTPESNVSTEDSSK